LTSFSDEKCQFTAEPRYLKIVSPQKLKLSFNLFTVIYFWRHAMKERGDCFLNRMANERCV